MSEEFFLPVRLGRVETRERGVKRKDKRAGRRDESVVFFSVETRVEYFFFLNLFFRKKTKKKDDTA